MGFQVSWNGNKNVKVKVDSRLFGKTCGICGVFNQDPSDDLIAGPSGECLTEDSTIEPGKLVSNLNAPPIVLSRAPHRYY